MSGSNRKEDEIVRRTRESAYMQQQHNPGYQYSLDPLTPSTAEQVFQWNRFTTPEAAYRRSNIRDIWNDSGFVGQSSYGTLQSTQEIWTPMPPAVTCVSDAIPVTSGMHSLYTQASAPYVGTFRPIQLPRNYEPSSWQLNLSHTSGQRPSGTTNIYDTLPATPGLQSPMSSSSTGTSLQGCLPNSSEHFLLGSNRSGSPAQQLFPPHSIPPVQPPFIEPQRDAGTIPQKSWPGKEREVKSTRKIPINDELTTAFLSSLPSNRLNTNSNAQATNQQTTLLMGNARPESRSGCYPREDGGRRRIPQGACYTPMKDESMGNVRPELRSGCYPGEDGGRRPIPQGACYTPMKDELPITKPKDESQGDALKLKPTYSDVVTKGPVIPKKPSKSATQKIGRQNHCRPNNKAMQTKDGMQENNTSTSNSLLKTKSDMAGLDDINLINTDNTGRQALKRASSKSTTRSSSTIEAPKSKHGSSREKSEEYCTSALKDQIPESASVSSKSLNNQQKEAAQKRSLGNNNRNSKTKLTGNASNEVEETESVKNKSKKDAHKKTFDDGTCIHKKETRTNGTSKVGSKKQSGKKKKDMNVAAAKKETRLMQLAFQFWYFVKIIATLVNWLLHLIWDVTSKTIGLVAQVCWYIGSFGFLYASYLYSCLQSQWHTFWKKKQTLGGIRERQSDTFIPTTGDDAMRRLLDCRNQDPYSILGVQRTCSNDDIKKYYRRQAVLVHPDKNLQPGADEAFKILLRAFQVIGDPDKRADYDSHQRTLGDWQEMRDLFAQFQKKRDEANNTIKCTNCNRRHRRIKTERKVYAARFCKLCKLSHSVREGDLWSESGFLGLFRRYYACMEGSIYDVTEWAGCQSSSLAHLRSNSHDIAYRIVSSTPSSPDVPPSQVRKNELNEFLCGLYAGNSGNRPSTRRKKPGKHRR